MIFEGKPGNFQVKSFTSEDIQHDVHVEKFIVSIILYFRSNVSKKIEYYNMYTPRNANRIFYIKLKSLWNKIDVDDKNTNDNEEEFITADEVVTNGNNLVNILANVNAHYRSHKENPQMLNDSDVAIVVKAAAMLTNVMSRNTKHQEANNQNLSA
ncbi:MAG: hypothetical protein EXX96DRAFT_561773 [Benjaminiella poitrasii]|nr:MAG: hypothetical protein EXX96DRAFT_561773 [Benjaminiella poitrasii]